MNKNDNNFKLTARAKLNLYLHVTGKRDDGYHLLDSLFVFADFGDELEFSSADIFDFTIKGRFADALGSEQNLVEKAYLKLSSRYTPNKGAKIVLTKNLPVASGLGGGSSDAAAAIKGMLKLWDIKPSANELSEIALGLGADVPACLCGESSQVSGIGEVITKAKKIPNLWVVMANPMVLMPTSQVFKNRKKAFSLEMPISFDYENAKAFVEELKKRTNDLEESAISLSPLVLETVKILNQTENCLLARMSGSGATCFSLYDDELSAQKAERLILEKQPLWFVKAAKIFRATL